MNKSSNYDVITIQVTQKTDNDVEYKLAFGLRNRTFYWTATIGQDRAVLAQLEVGEKYSIRVATDQYGTQHWLEAKPIASGRMKSDALTKKMAKAKAQRQMSESFLIWD